MGHYITPVASHLLPRGIKSSITERKRERITQVEETIEGALTPFEYGMLPLFLLH